MKGLRESCRPVNYLLYLCCYFPTHVMNGTFPSALTFTLVYAILSLIMENTSSHPDLPLIQDADLNGKTVLVRLITMW